MYAIPRGNSPPHTNTPLPTTITEQYRLASRLYTCQNPIHLPVEFGRLEAMPEISRLDDIYAEMSRYSPTPTHTPKPPEIEPRGSGEVGKSFDVDC